MKQSIFTGNHPFILNAFFCNRARRASNDFVRRLLLFVCLFTFLGSLNAQPVIGNNSFNNGATTNTSLAPVGTATPFTRTLMGWDITLSTTSTGALTHQYTGGEQFLQFSTPTGANFNYLEFGSSNGMNFKLNSMEIGSITRALTYNFTGYRDGAVVSGATHSASLPMYASSSANYGVVNFPTTGAFNNIDKIRVSFSTAQAGSLFIRADDINISSAGTAMPLTLLSFAVKRDRPNVGLSWITAAEDNVDRFEIEKSTDGASFVKIGVVAARGNGASGNTTYSYSDIQVGTTVQYYRLKMVDRDGQFTYSPVQRLSAVEAKEQAWLHPNPVQGSIIKVELPRLPSSPLSYTLINSAGIIVQQGLLRDKVEQLNVEALAKGIYLLQLANGEALKFRKE